LIVSSEYEKSFEIKCFSRFYPEIKGKIKDAATEKKPKIPPMSSDHSLSL
jgi:hypothetical protein